MSSDADDQMQPEDWEPKAPPKPGAEHSDPDSPEDSSEKPPTVGTTS